MEKFNLMHLLLHHPCIGLFDISLTDFIWFYLNAFVTQLITVSMDWDQDTAGITEATGR